MRAAWLVVFAACSAPVHPQPDSGVPDSGTPPVNVRIMSWNVRQLGADGGSPARIAQLINQLDPQLVTVQEISSTGTYDALAAALPDYEGHAGVLAATSGNLLQAVFSKGVSVTDVRNIFDTDTNFPRPPLEWHTTVNGTTFTVTAVHLKAGIGTANEQTRIDALRTLDTHVRAQLDAGWLLLGDFNEAPSDPRYTEAFTPLTAAPLIHRTADAGFYTYLPRMLLLDHVVATFDGGVLTAPRLDQSESDYALVSDHLPLVLDLTF